MNSYAHPILSELSRQLPEDALTVQYIQQAAEFDKITGQAQKDISCLESLIGATEDRQTAKPELEKSGYREWLSQSDTEEHLRVLGTLRLIADLSEDLAEE
jgi:hypothetical protein